MISKIPIKMVKRKNGYSLITDFPSENSDMTVNRKNGYSLIADFFKKKRSDMSLQPLCGYSLIEILIVVSIFSVIALVVSQTLFSTLKGAAKSEVGSSIKQEANYVIAVMERAIHNARQINTPCGPTSIT